MTSPLQPSRDRDAVERQAWCAPRRPSRRLSDVVAAAAAAARPRLVATLARTEPFAVAARTRVTARPAVVVLPTVVLTALLVAATAVPPRQAPADAAAAAVAGHARPGATVDVAAPAPAAPVSDEVPGEPVRFASYEDLELFLPSRRAMLSGFHEASYRDALRLRPWGTPLASDNPRKDAVAPVGEGPNYAIMSTRGRATHATSAVDVAMPRHAPVASPVSGTVTSVRPYELYGRYADTRIDIRPAERPDLTVTVLHVSDPQVRPGEEVVGGRTTIAGRATAFPFRSHVDAYAGGRPPHVHVELKRG